MTKMPPFLIACNHFRYEIIFVSISLVRSDFRLYFVSVLLNISLSLFVSVNEILFFMF